MKNMQNSFDKNVLLLTDCVPLSCSISIFSARLSNLHRKLQRRFEVNRAATPIKTESFQHEVTQMGQTIFFSNLWQVYKILHLPNTLNELGVMYFFMSKYCSSQTNWYGAKIMAFLVFCSMLILCRWLNLKWKKLHCSSAKF